MTVVEGKLTIPEVLDRFAAYYAMHPAWGALHIVLADGNIDDEMIGWCREMAQERGDLEAVALADFLLRMTKSQRRRLPRRVWDALYAR